MFAPCNLTHLSVNDITYIFPERPSKKSYYIILILQKRQHAFVLEENKLGVADRLVADRLKYIFGLAPIHTVMARLSMTLRMKDKLPRAIITEPKDYILSATPMWRDENNNISFVQEPDLIEAMKLIPSLMKDDKFKLGVIKIFLFRFLVGASNSNFSSIRVRTVFRKDKNGNKIGKYIPVSHREEKLGKKDIPNTRLSQKEKYIVFNDKELIDIARKELIDNFDHDNMRGIVLQTRKPEPDVKNRRPRKALSIPANKLCNLIEERIDILGTIEISELVFNIC